MQYNIHPIFVHFPIALLSIYSIVVLIPFKKWLPRIAWHDITCTLLFFGVIGAFFALSTGEVAEHLTTQTNQLVETHALFATAATWIYGVLLIGALLNMGMVRDFLEKNRFLIRYQKHVSIIRNFLSNRYFVVVLSISGFVAITIAGVLGGVMVYGTTADPFASIVLRLLQIQL